MKPRRRKSKRRKKPKHRLKLPKRRNNAKKKRQLKLRPGRKRRQQIASLRGSISPPKRRTWGTASRRKKNKRARA